MVLSNLLNALTFDKWHLMQIFNAHDIQDSILDPGPSGATAAQRPVSALLWSGGAGLASLDWLLQLSEILRAVNTLPVCYSDQREITDKQFRCRIQWEFPRSKAKGEGHSALIHGRVKKGLAGEFKLCKTVGMSVVRWWANCTISSQSAQRLHFNISHFSSPTTTTAARRPTAVSTTPGQLWGCGLIFIQSRPLHPEIDPNFVVV